MDRFVTRGAAPAREVAKGQKKAKAKQVTLASLAKVQVLPHSCLNFGPEELDKLKRRLEDAEASTPAQTLDALRVLSSLVISTADLQSSMLGRTVNRLAKRAAPGSEVARLATNLVTKWRVEVDRATAALDGKPVCSAAVAKPMPRAPAVLVDSSAAFDAELSSVAASATMRRRSSGASGNSRGAVKLAADERARARAAMHAALMQGSSSGASRVLALALALEAAVHAAGMPVLTMLSALGANESLRAALLSGWLDPADAAAMTGRALMTSEFL